jgi:hypothetical protein
VDIPVHRMVAGNAIKSDCYMITSRPKFREKMQGARVVILTGDFQGQQGVCLGGETAGGGLWAISPDGSNEILSLVFEKDFGLLVDLSSNPSRN